jgi:hypothetical protein
MVVVVEAMVVRVLSQILRNGVAALTDENKTSRMSSAWLYWSLQRKSDFVLWCSWRKENLQELRKRFLASHTRLNPPFSTIG